METIEPINCIEEIINNDIQEGKCKAVQTRHPPEPKMALFCCAEKLEGERLGNKKLVARGEKTLFFRLQN